MQLEKRDRKHIIESITNKFGNYDFIYDDYVNSFIDAIINGEATYDGMNINISDYTDDMNPHFYIMYKIQNALYTKLCALSSIDADILIYLVEDKMKIALMIARRLNYNDTSKCEDYLMEAIGLFDGSEAFDSFITRYLMAKIKGVPFEAKKKEKVVETHQEEKKTKPKKKQNRKKRECIKDVVVEVDTSNVVSEEVTDTPYSYLDRICGDRKGQEKVDPIVEMVRLLNIIKISNPDASLEYSSYFLLRFGYYNGTYFSLQEISMILKLDMEKIISFERIVLNKAKEIILEKMDMYEGFVLNKVFAS